MDLTSDLTMILMLGKGITIGLVVVPQAMAYALLAQLTPAYGLYTSFTGAVLYWLFGTSKDIVIGVRTHQPSLKVSNNPILTVQIDNSCWLTTRWTSCESCRQGCTR